MSARAGLLHRIATGVPLAAAAVAVALVAGCATTAPAVGPDAPPITAGRLGVRVDATAARPSQNFSAAFELQGNSERGQLRLLSPIGTEVARAEWRPGLALLVASGNEGRYASLDDLAEHVLGERVPLAALPDWVEGRPWPGAAYELSAQGFRQLGWDVDLSARADGRILARRLAPPAVLLRVVLDAPAR